ncbi:Telomerase ribonucleoprotein complex RNA-binding domain-containing protein [Neocallimastix sp. 'constans']
MLTLHDLVQKFKISDCDWLYLDNTNKSKKKKVSLSEFNKQKEILYILLSFICKNIIIPLIKYHFYVTETIPYKYKLFYYRQDLWKKMCLPIYKKFTSTIFKEVKNVIVIYA